MNPYEKLIYICENRAKFEGYDRWIRARNGELRRLTNMGVSVETLAMLIGVQPTQVRTILRGKPE